jgi:hypothetical protein
MGVAGFFTIAEGSLICSSHSSHDFFSPTVVEDRLFGKAGHRWFVNVWLSCFCGAGESVFLHGFSLIN